MHISELLSARAIGDPGKTALAAPGVSSLSYRELLEQTGSISRELNGLGIGRGDRVAIVFPNGPEIALAFLVASSTAVSAPLNPAYRQAEFEFFLADLGAKALLIDKGLDSPARVVAQNLGIPTIDAEFQRGGKAGVFAIEGGGQSGSPPQPLLQSHDIALVLHTSGTTSRPKIVPLSHANLLASASNIAHTLELSPADRCLNIMPLFHIHGLVAAVLASLYAGGEVVCTPGLLAPSFYEWLDSFRPSWYTAVPTMHQIILARARDNREIIARSRLRFVRSSSASLPPTVMAELEHTFNAPVLEAYGMTEASHQMASNPLPPRPRKPGSVGMAAGLEIEIMDEAGNLLQHGETGEIVIRGENVSLGYDHNPEANAAAFHAGWFRTSDQGYLDPDGYLYLTGRLKELINRGGEKISPRRVEDVLLEHPAVAQAVTFAMPDERLGEDVASAIVLRSKQATTERELRDFCALRLAPFEVPRRVLFLDELPKGATGKLQRIGLADKLGLTGETRATAGGAEYSGPRSALEIVLASLWENTLGVARVGRDDEFIRLGGDSILAAQLISRVREALDVELPITGLFEEASTLRGMAETISYLRNTPEKKPVSVASHLSLNQPQPLSFVEERFWFFNELEPESPVSMRSCAFHLLGSLDATALERSFDEISRRHDILRSQFVAANGTPLVKTISHRPMTLNRIDLTELPEGDREQEARRLIRSLARKPFDLNGGDTLLRPTLLIIGEQDQVLLIVQSHISSDGWSDRVLRRELGILYDAFASGQPPALQELPLQYADYAREQRAQMQGEALNEPLAYWKEHLGGDLAPIELPTDRPRPAVQTSNGARFRFELPQSLVRALGDLGRDSGVTRFMTLLAAFQALLFRYNGQDKIIVGVPVAGRDRVEWENLIGCFMNTITLRTDLAGNPTFRELLARVRRVALGAYAHQSLPFELLVQELQPVRSLSHSPLFQVMFQLRSLPEESLKLHDLTVQEFDFDSGISPFDFSFDIEERDGKLRVTIDYSTDLFELATIERMAGHYRTLLEAATLDPDRPLLQLPILSESERRQILLEWNDTNAEYPRERSLHRLFEDQAERVPGAIALVFKEQSTTYRELNERANQLAHYLVKLGVTTETRVGIAATRSREMLIGVLGILKAGGAYVPLDPNYPVERLRFILEDTGAAVLVTQSAMRDKFREYRGQNVCLDCDWDSIGRESRLNLPTEVTGQNLAYVIYTSGSTGKPKGVLITHSGVVNVLTADATMYHLGRSDRFLAFSSLSFDASVFDLFVPLSIGGTIILANEETMYDGSRLRDLYASSAATVIGPTATSLRILLDSGWVGSKSLRIITGGEALDLDLAERAVHCCAELWNSYGPTEGTIESTTHRVERPIEYDIIGRPNANTRAYVLNHELQPQPARVPGELYLGGVGIARGYLNRPELTAEHFIPDPFSRDPGARLYKTGDRARYLPDGNIEFLGRTDSQVKLHGYRIELGEIEAALTQHPDVSFGAVSLRTDDHQDPRLVAYVSHRAGTSMNVSDLRQFLLRSLPDYMVPSSFVSIDTPPLTSSGKLDRGALPAPTPSRHGVRRFVEPRTPTEVRVAAIWMQLLHVDLVGRNDNFFDLGGHSLLAAQVVSRLRDAFQIELPLRALFESHTLEELAERIDGNRNRGEKPAPPPLVRLERRPQPPPG